jgi:L-alanine-DL-glutamate epimerase-like enolase superfamily enzyme
MKMRSGNTVSAREFRRRDFIAAPVALAAVRRLQAAVKPIRIVSIEAFPIDIPVSEAEERAGLQHRFQVAKLTTDAGVTGWSFAGPPETAVNDIRAKLINIDLFNVEQMLQRGLNRYAGVEHAVWDAIGRIANQPVYKLLGGPRDRLKAYLTCVWSGPADQSHVPAKDQVAMALKIQKAGFNAMKIRIWRPDPMDDVSVCGQILGAAGGGFRLMVDRTAQMPVSMANQQVWNFETALKVARALEQAGVYWLEEPFHRDDYESPAKLAGMVDILITGGEGYSSLEPYKQCLTHRSYDILQPDPHQAGGILMCKKVAVLAEAFHVPAIPHGHIGLPLAGWFQASLAMGSEYQEVTMVSPPLLPEEQWAPGLKVLKGGPMFRFENGEIIAPELPGLGLDVDEAAVEHFRIHRG